MVHFINEPPYNDDYNAGKRYLQILAKPAFPEQAREFTQAQTTLFDHISRIGNTLMSSGDIVEGMSFQIEQGGRVTISDGRISMEGLIMDFEQQSVTVPLTGLVTIGVEVKYSVVTATDDLTLRDPAQGVSNQGAEGADRVKYTVSLTVNNPSAPVIYRVMNGQLLTNNNRPDMSGMNELLARRTFDESGNYKVEGLKVTPRDRKLYPDNTKEYVNISEGKAYVKGYEINRQSANIQALRTASDSSSTSNELKRYVDGVKTYPLNNSTIKTINRVTMDIKEDQNVTRSSNSDTDNLVSVGKSVTSILKVSQSDVVYEYGKDYEISPTRSGIRWLTGTGGGKAPSSGSTYQIEVVVLQNLLSTHYSVVMETNKEVLKFSTGAPKPYFQPNSQFIGTFTVEYDFYYIRKDLLCLDADGAIVVLEGVPNTPDKVQPPINQNPDLLDLAVATVSKSGVDACFNIADVRTTMQDINRIIRRLNTLEMNQAISSLDRQAEAGEDASNLSGIYTEGFLNIEKADINHPLFDCAIDLDNQEVTTTSQQSVFEVNINDKNSDVNYMGRIISAPFTDKLVKIQSMASERMLVNPYAEYSAMGFIALNPSVDTWIDATIINDEKVAVKNVTLRRWWYHKGEAWAEEERRAYEKAGFSDGGASLGWSSGMAVTGSSVVKSTVDKMIAFMRQREVLFTGTNFAKSSDNIECLFNGVRVAVTPTGTTIAGTKAGTIRSDALGKFTGKFTVPANIQCGTVVVEFRNESGSGTTSYTASGIQRTTTNTVLTTITNVKPVDPLAQTFFFEEDTYLTQVGIYMAVKSNSSPLIIEIRNTVNGYPGTICYDRVLVDSADIKVSEKGTVETKVNLNQPVYCKTDTWYSLCLLSDSNEYQTFTATLGERDIVTQKPISTQADVGVLFSSANAITWTAHQKSDLKYALYAAQYNPEGGVIIFDDVKSEEISRILLATDFIDNQNSGVTWQYSYDNGYTWIGIENYRDQELVQNNVKVVSLKAIIQVSNNSSPLMARDNISLVTFLNDTEFNYIGRNVQLDAPYKEVIITVDTNTKSTEGVDHSVYFSADGSGTNWIEMKNPEIRPVNSEMDRYTYTHTVPSSDVYTNYRHRLHMNTNNPLVRPRAARLVSIMRQS